MKKIFTRLLLNIKKQQQASRVLTAVFLLAAANLFIIQPASAQTRRYVKSRGSGTGTGSWNNASGNLQATITASSPGDEIWVMKGQYQPASGGSFNMAPGVKIYGSFAGAETSLAERVIGITGSDSSRLIGNGASVIINNNNGLNATAVLDGFFITGGKAEGQEAKGGGMYNNNVSPTISHCIFYNNIAKAEMNGKGGGMYNYMASPTVSYCIFSNDSAVGTSQGLGGGMYCEQSSPVITNTFFSGNVVKGSPLNFGAGIFFLGSATAFAPTLTNCIFLGNSGGAAGGMFTSGSAPVLTSCSFSGNSGAVYGYASGVAPSFINCIVWGNGSGISGTPGYAGYATPTVSNSIVQGGYAGTGNLNINPLFVSQPDYTKAPAVTGDLLLQSSSPAIDMGNNAALPANTTTDLAGNPRIYNSIVDMGAYEYQGNASATAPAAGNRTASMTVSTTGTSTFLTDANGLIASVTGDGTATSVAGNVTAKVWIEPAVPALNDQPYVARHYEITPPSSNATGTVTLYYTQQDFTNFNNAPGAALKLPVNAADNEGYKANLRISKYSLTSSDGTGLMNTYHNGATIINPDDANITWNGNYWAVSFTVTGFSGFFVQTSLNALPVKWISSNALISSQGNAVISWKVQEQNVAGYEIQKSADGINFQSAGTVNSTGDGENNYSFTEAGHFTGTAYYRIKQTDKDGKTSLSSILKLQSSTAGKTVVLVYPNPVNEITVINISSPGADKIDYKLIDSRGIILQQSSMQVNAGNSIIPLNTSICPAGIYYLDIKGKTIHQQIKIVK